jgi:hypothetical protein
MNARRTRGTGGRGAPGLAAVLLAVLLAPPPAAAEQQTKPPKEDYSKEPGYVDFESMRLFGEEEAIVEVYLHDALLGMVAAVSRSADPELSDMLAKLRLVRVQKFRLEDEEKLGSVEGKLAELARKLEQGGWMRAVRVREGEESVYVYLKMGDSLLQGITVMAVEPGTSATFVNIVGEIDPEQVGRLGRKFDIHELDKLENWDKHVDEAGEEKPEKKDKKK